jgi:hypothetical protein
MFSKFVFVFFITFALSSHFACEAAESNFEFESDFKSIRSKLSRFKIKDRICTERIKELEKMLLDVEFLLYSTVTMYEHNFLYKFMEQYYEVYDAVQEKFRIIEERRRSQQIYAPRQAQTSIAKYTAKSNYVNEKQESWDWVDIFFSFAGKLFNFYMMIITINMNFVSLVIQVWNWVGVLSFPKRLFDFYMLFITVNTNFLGLVIQVLQNLSSHPDFVFAFNELYTKGFNQDSLYAIYQRIVVKIKNQNFDNIIIFNYPSDFLNYVSKRRLILLAALVMIYNIYDIYTTVKHYVLKCFKKLCRALWLSFKLLMLSLAAITILLMV